MSCAEESFREAKQETGNVLIRMHELDFMGKMMIGKKYLFRSNLLYQQNYATEQTD